MDKPGKQDKNDKGSANASEGTAAQRSKAIETAMSQIEKQFGKGAIMKLGAESKLDVQTISTGSLSLDSRSARITDCP